MSIENKNSQERITGIWYAVAAFLAWGFLPIYWKLLKNVPAKEILSHRIFWSFIFVSLILVKYGRWGELKKVISQKRNLVTVLCTAILITINWFLYIWAVNANHIVEASLGYYINPLISVLLGIVVLKERLTFWQIIAFALALIGVLIITLEYGQIPWIALTLAITFGLYGLVKKLANLDSIIALALETIILTPVALFYIVTQEVSGTGALLGNSSTTTLLLIGAGVVTALPLLWFAMGATKVPLTTLGFIQYLGPSISLIIGIFMYNEPFTQTHLVTFGFIWSGLLIFSFSGTKVMKDIEKKVTSLKQAA